MQHNSRPPPRDPLAETWPDDPDGRPLSDRQVEYLLGVIERLEKQVPSAEDVAYLKRKREEDEAISYLWGLIKKHAPWVATVSALIGSAVAYVLTHNFHITNK